MDIVTAVIVDILFVIGGMYLILFGRKTYVIIGVIPTHNKVLGIILLIAGLGILDDMQCLSLGLITMLVFGCLFRTQLFLTCKQFISKIKDITSEML